MKKETTEKKSWKQRLKDGEKIQDIVFSEPEMNINEWLEKCKKEGLSDRDENWFLRCADRFDRIKFEKVSPQALAKQFKKTGAVQKVKWTASK